MTPAEPDTTLSASIVVATYASGPELDRLVASLDAQTLPTDQWEAIFIDDGSPDDTFHRLREFARHRPHFRIEQIENSGWPCRPRNVGLEMARGAYVGFMDHDDELYPDALRAGAAYAALTHADVLNGKEARTSDASWALTTYEQNRPQVLGTESTHGALAPMNPHKLYRRAFLLEHDIRFREGGRVLWEDVFFNLRALAHAEVIATMADTPYYHWNTTAGSGSTTFRRSNSEWWYWFGEMLDAIASDLAEPRLDHERKALLDRQYRTRLLDAFNNSYPRRSAASRKLIFEHARHLQTTHFSSEADSGLGVSDRMRAHLLRIGHPHALHRLTEEDPKTAPSARVDAVGRDGDGFEISCATTWLTPTGTSPWRREGSRVVRVLPEPLERILDAELRDGTEELHSMTANLTVRSQTSRIAWELKGVSDTDEVTDPDGTVTHFIRTRATIAPSIAALGSELEPGVWDVKVHSSKAGSDRTAPLCGSCVPIIARIGSRIAAVYTDAHNHIVLDIGEAGASLTDLTVPTGTVRVEQGLILVKLTSALDEGPALRTSLRRSTASGRALRRQRAAIRRDERTFDDPYWSAEQVSVESRDGAAWISIPISAGSEITAHFGARTPDGGGLFRLAAGGVHRLAAPKRTGRSLRHA